LVGRDLNLKKADREGAIRSVKEAGGKSTDARRHHRLLVARDVSDLAFLWWALEDLNL
jgi:hypothetical protein